MSHDWRVWPARHPKAACLIAAVLLLLCAGSMARMKPDGSLAGMFAKNDPAATALVRVLDDFSAVEELLLLVSVPESQRAPTPDTARLLNFADRLDRAVAGSPEATALTAGVLYRADDETRAFFEKVLVPHALFYLDDADFDAARRRLSRAEMTKQIRQNEAMISAPGPAAQALAKAFLQDPLRLHEFVLARLTASRPFKTYGDSDAFLSPDGHSLLIRIRGKRPPGDIDFSAAITRVVGDLAAKANTDGLRVEVTGAYAIAATSAASIRHDMIVNVTSSVVLLQILFVLAYRRPIRLFLLAFGPVVAGIAWGLGAYAFFSPTVSPLTAVVGGILAGMGIDYSIQYLSTYLTRRAAGATALDAAESTSRSLAMPMFGAFLTSVVGFAAVASSSVPALRNFAVVGSLGLAGTFLAAVALLPGILVLTGGRSATPGVPFRLRIDPFLTLIARRRQAALTFCAMLMVAALAILARPGPILPLESDLNVMHPSPNPALAGQLHIAQRMGASADSLLLHLRADTPAHLQSLAHAADARLRSAAARNAGVTGTFGLATLLPDPAIAPARLAAIGPAVADRVVTDFKAAVADSIFSPAAFDPYAGFLNHLLTRPAAPTLADLTPYRHLAQTILPTSATAATPIPPTEAITLVFLKDPLATRADRQRVITTLRAALADLPGVTLTGMSVVAQDTEATIRHDLPRFVVIAVAVVILYLLIHFRAVRPALLAILPALFDITCLLAILRLTGQHLNMVNLVALPILIGIDVDYGIFLVSLARQRTADDESSADLIARLAPSAHAVVLCAIAIIIGFGSLIFTTVPAIRSLGFAVGVGVLACLTSNFLLLLPLLLGYNRSAQTR